MRLSARLSKSVVIKLLVQVDLVQTMQTSQIHPLKSPLSTGQNSVDLKHYVYQLERMSWLIGISFRKPRNFRVYLLVIGILFELITTAIADYFLEYDDKLFLSLGNFSSYFFTDQRRLISPIITVYRWSTFIFVINHLWWTDHQWLENANSRYQRLPSRFSMNKPKLDLTLRRGQVFVVFNFVFTATTVSSMVMFGYYYMRNNTFQEVLPTLLLQLLYNSVYPAIQAIFFAQYYLICKFCVQIASQINQDLLTVLNTQNWNLASLNQSLSVFSFTCNIISECNRFMSRVYVIFLLFVMTFSVPLIYSILYLRVVDFILLVILVFLVYFILQIFFMSSIAGQVDAQIKNSIEQLYREFACEHHLNAWQKIALKMRIIQFFDQVECGSIGMSIMGNPINTFTCIKIATGFMSILALLLGNRKKHYCAEKRQDSTHGSNVTVIPFQLLLNDTLVQDLVNGVFGAGNSYFTV